MSAPFDLDALLAEANKDRSARPVILGGVTYDLPAVLPALVGDRLSKGNIEAALELLFGVEHVAAVAPLIGIDEDGCPVLEAIIQDVYGLGDDTGPIEAAAAEKVKAKQKPKLSLGE